MKLIKVTMVGLFAFSLMFAQQNQPQGNPGPPEMHDGKSAVDHFMMAVQEGMDRGVLDQNDQNYLMELVPKMQDAVKSEYEDGADGAAGEVASEFDEWLQGLRDEGGESEEVAKRLAMELCMVESEAHRMMDPEGDHGDMHCGGPHGGPDGPSPAVMDAWMSGMQPDGYFDFGAAFDAAESTAKQEAQDTGEYDEESWDECADAGRAAMEAARADNKSPQEVFQAVAEAVNACGETQGQGDDGDHMGGDHMGGDHMGGDHMGDDHGQGQPPYSPSVMNSVQKYMENNWAVDDSKRDNQEWMDAYNNYDSWKPHGGDHMGGDHMGGDHMGGDHMGEGGPPPMPVYEDMDQNGDGEVNPEEAMAYFQNRPDWNDDAANNFDADFNRVDKNEDGVVSKDEHMDEVAKVMVEGRTKEAMMQGMQGEDVFNFVAEGLYAYFVEETGWRTQEEWEAGRNAAFNKYMEELGNGSDPGAAMGAALQAGQAENDPN